MCQLTGLWYFDVRGNNISGTIPDNIGNCTSYEIEGWGPDSRSSASGVQWTRGGSVASYHMEAKMGLTFTDVRKKVGNGCSISQRSTMVMKGQNVCLADLSLDGAPVINAAEEAEVVEMTNTPKSFLIIIVIGL